MSKELLITPQYNTLTIKLPVWYRINSDREGAYNKFEPSVDVVLLFSKEQIKDRRKAYQKALATFQSFMEEFTYTPYNRQLKSWLNEFEEKKKLPIHKFITIKEKEFIMKEKWYLYGQIGIDKGGFAIYDYKTPYKEGNKILCITYLEIREELLSFLQQKIGDSFYLSVLKDLFKKTPSDINNYEKYLGEKARFLLKLDTSGLLSELQKDPVVDEKDKDAARKISVWDI